MGIFLHTWVWCMVHTWLAHYICTSHYHTSSRIHFIVSPFFFPLEHLLDFFSLSRDNLLPKRTEFFVFCSCEIACHLDSSLMMRDHCIDKCTIEFISSFSCEHFTHISHAHIHHIMRIGIYGFLSRQARTEDLASLHGWLSLTLLDKCLDYRRLSLFVFSRIMHTFTTIESDRFEKIAISHTNSYRICPYNEDNNYTNT